MVTSSLKSSKLSRSCQNRILYQFYYMSCFALCLGNTADAWSHRAGSLSAIYNVHLGRHSDIPKLFRPPLSRHVPHILCLLLTLHIRIHTQNTQLQTHKHTNTQIQLKRSPYLAMSLTSYVSGCTPHHTATAFQPRLSFQKYSACDRVQCAMQCIVAFLFLSQHSPPRIHRHLPRQAA